MLSVSCICRRQQNKKKSEKIKEKTAGGWGPACLCKKCKIIKASTAATWVLWSSVLWTLSMGPQFDKHCG